PVLSGHAPRRHVRCLAPDMSRTAMSPLRTTDTARRDRSLWRARPRTRVVERAAVRFGRVLTPDCGHVQIGQSVRSELSVSAMAGAWHRAWPEWPCPAALGLELEGGHVAEEVAHLRRGGEAELGLEEPAVGAVAAYRLRVVALGEVEPDQRPVRALAQRVGPERGEAGLGGEPEAAVVGELLRERLEGVQPELQ